jgi:hypothetical protein
MRKINIYSKKILYLLFYTNAGIDCICGFYAPFFKKFYNPMREAALLNRTFMSAIINIYNIIFFYRKP